MFVRQIIKCSCGCEFFSRTGLDKHLRKVKQVLPAHERIVGTFYRNYDAGDQPVPDARYDAKT